MVGRCACAACLAVRRRGRLLRFAHLPACPKLYAQPRAHHCARQPHTPHHSQRIPAFLLASRWWRHRGWGGRSCRACTPSSSIWTRVGLLRCCCVDWCCLDHARFLPALHAIFQHLDAGSPVALLLCFLSCAACRHCRVDSSGTWALASVFTSGPVALLATSVIPRLLAHQRFKLPRGLAHCNKQPCTPLPSSPHRQVGHPDSRGAEGGAAAAGQVGDRRERRGAHMRGLAGHLVMGLCHVRSS